MSLLFLIILQSLIFIYLSYKLVIYLRKKFITYKSNSLKKESKTKIEDKKTLDDSKKLDPWKILNPYDEQIFGQGQPNIIAPEEKMMVPNNSQMFSSNVGEGMVSNNQEGMVSNNQEGIIRNNEQAIILNSAKDVKDHLLRKETKRIEEPKEPEFISRPTEIKPLERQGGLIPANMERKKVKIENLVSSLIDILID